MVWIAEVLRIVHPQPLLATIGGTALAAFIVLAWLRASRHIRVLFLVVMAACTLMAWRHGQWEAIARGFDQSQIFGAFLPAVLLLRATAMASPRLAHLRETVAGLDEAGVRNWTLYGSHALGAVLNVGAMSIVAPVVARDPADAGRAELAGSAARGVGMAVMWSPFFVAIAFTSQLAPQTRVWEVMLIGAGLTVIGFMLSHFIFTPSLRLADLGASLVRLAPLAAPTLALLAAVVAATVVLHLTALQSVSLVIPLCCIAYLPTLARDARRRSLALALAAFSRLADELLIVVGATMLGVVVAALPEVRALAADVTPGMIAGPMLLAALVLSLVALGFVGLHPMIGASVLVPVLAGGAFGLCAVVVVSAAVFAWGLSSAVSIWTLPVVVASNAFGVSVRQLLSPRALVFGAVYAIAGVVYLAAANAALESAGCIARPVAMASDPFPRQVARAAEGRTHGNASLTVMTRPGSSGS